MLIIKRGYERKYAYGGSGIFDTVASVFGKIVSNPSMQKLAMDAGGKALNAAGDAAGKKAVSEIEKRVKQAFSKKPQLTLKSLNVDDSKQLTPKSRQILATIGEYPETSISNLISGQTRYIQDLAKSLNGSGLKRII